ncbi:proton-coupled zinc antiporter SLC30A2 [Sabethes cyaneus]|uniref:proton-coupled zinc antiporter SLC30A2 n=1 Tax=Sabethes cyaneus TaxID=53552 RepID=UPI00237E85BF|nr:proton-coupled zinc antiporter SLC30A2 [Sabethes cyaneus]
MSVYLQVSTTCDDEMYDSGNSGNNNTSSQQNLLSIASVSQSLAHPTCKFNHSLKNDESYGETEKRKLTWAIVFTVAFMLAQFIGGYLSGSLAIMTDAAHMLSDCISFLIAVISIWISNKPPDGRMSFGYRRVEVIGALLSIFGIWILTVFLVVASAHRLIHDDFDIDANSMIVIAVLGVVMNIAIALVLHGSCAVVPHAHHGHSHGHSHVHAQKNGYSKPVGSISVAPAPSRSRSHSPRKKKPQLRLEKFNLCDEKRTCQMEQLTIPNLPHTPSVSPHTSLPNTRHNSFTVKTASSTNLENILHIARKKLNTEALRQRMSLDAGGNSPDIITSSKFLYNKMDADDCLTLSRSRRDSCDSQDLSSEEEHCSNHHHPQHGDENLNVRAAIIHVIGDFIQSIGVLIAAIIIKFQPTFKIVDPICTLLFSVIVLVTTVRIFRDSVRILMDAVPTSVAVDKLSTELECISGVKAVHDLNVWSISTGLNVMTVHLMVDPIANTSKILVAAHAIAQNGFNIKKCTVQIEKITFRA